MPIQYKYRASESDIKKACEDYLQIQQNQGKLIYFRLNAGDFIEVRGDTRRRIKGVPKGTADFEIIRTGPVLLSTPQVIFIEIKSPKGKQTHEQWEFMDLVKFHGCQYHLIRDADELIALLEEK